MKSEKKRFNINIENFHQYYYNNKTTNHEPVPDLMFTLLEKTEPPKGYTIEKETIHGVKCLRIENVFGMAVIVYKQPMFSKIEPSNEPLDKPEREYQGIMGYVDQNFKNIK